MLVKCARLIVPNLNALVPGSSLSTTFSNMPPISLQPNLECR